MRDEIYFSPKLRLKTGIRKVTRLRPLAAGGSGIVYVAEVQYVGGATRQMAWKEIMGSFVRLEREGLPLHYEAAREVDGVVPVELEIDIRRQSKGNPDLVVALSELRGASLASYLFPDPRKGAPPLSASRRLRLAEIVAEQGSRILAGLRSRDIVHHDVKPENFVIAGGEENDIEELLEGRAHLELLDFGTALKRGEARPKMSGTLAYVSPWALTDPVHRPTNDLYALGIVLAEILLDRSAKSSVLAEFYPPWPGFSEEEVQSNVARGMGSSLKGFEADRLDHLTRYVLSLLGSTQISGPMEVFVPRRAP